MHVLEIILAVLLCLVSLGLIAVIMLQSGKEAGLGALTGNSNSYMGQGKAANKERSMAAMTKWLALAFAILVLALNLV